ncbi:transcriptional regulator [Rhodococcus tibetensis]|uniref:Transcriptional regulator n=1 Tax=Rhodococcus tibetensis TaxID=2965064 RepID=A0ABT1Q8U6_9NOCA|nr:transcriptional regulator [Rhodococcus sp. FXJ9.536]MCQ4118683.1 transcriptional regulator [Rhodococcus sp. FXJ9.536]
MSGNRKRSRPALVLLVVAGAATCLALGWWQWERFEAVGGNGQNLGYAFQWPLFAAFFIYAYRRFVQLEDADPAEAEKAADEVKEIPADVLPPRPTVDVVTPEDGSNDLETLQVQQYNEYLAELAACETDRSTT